jgi:hypothetical protein
VAKPGITVNGDGWNEDSALGYAGDSQAAAMVRSWERRVAIRAAEIQAREDSALLDLDPMHLCHGLQIAAISGLGRCDSEMMRMRSTLAVADEKRIERNAAKAAADYFEPATIRGTMKGIGA